MVSNKKSKKYNTRSSKTKKCLQSGKKIYDLKTKGVMLAHNFSDPRTGKRKNPVKGFPPPPIGWFLSEKYDGYRAIWDGKNFRSRNNNIFNVPEKFSRWLPSAISLDGELFLGRDKFQQCGIFRKKVPIEEEWEDVKYHIFDTPGHTGLFEERQEFIEKIILERNKCFTDSKSPLILTKQTEVKSETQVEKEFENLISKGGEGIMLRAPKSPYEGKRTAHLLKYKKLYDAECKIIGYKNGSGKYKNMLGSFKCILTKNSKIKFDISGMNDKIRKNYLETHPIGTIVTFTYMGFSNSGVPRHPQYLRIRLKE